MADDLEAKIKEVFCAIAASNPADRPSLTARLSGLSSRSTTRNELLWVARCYLGLEDHPSVIAVCDKALRREGTRGNECIARVFKGYSLCMLGVEASRHGDADRAKRLYTDTVETLNGALDFSAKKNPGLMMFGMYSFIAAHHYLGNHELVSSACTYLRKNQAVLAKASQDMVRNLRGYLLSSLIALKQKRDEEKKKDAKEEYFMSLIAGAKRTYDKPN